MFDQRGDPFVRAFGHRIDIGACEAQSLSLVVDTLADESGGNFGVGDRSLREAIEFRAHQSGADEIRFSPALTAGGPATIVLTLGELQIKDDVAIDGPGAEPLTIDANGDRGFNIDDLDPLNHLNVRISGLTITGGDIIGSGSGICAVENFTLERSIVTGNRTTDIGGGIFLRADPGIAQTISRIHIVRQYGHLRWRIALCGQRRDRQAYRQHDLWKRGCPRRRRFAALRFPDRCGGTVVLLRSTISGNTLSILAAVSQPFRQLTFSFGSRQLSVTVLTTLAAESSLPRLTLSFSRRRSAVTKPSSAAAYLAYSS